MNLLKQRRSQVAFLVIGIIIIGGVSLASTVWAQPIKNQLNAWQLLPQPERLTELYFANPNHLPSTYAPGQAQAIAFTVHNLEYQPTTYRYTVTAQADGSATMTTLTTGSFRLDQNQSITTPVSVTLPDLGPRVKVAITLTDQNESIDYWVNRSAK